MNPQLEQFESKEAARDHTSVSSAAPANARPVASNCIQESGSQGHPPEPQSTRPDGNSQQGSDSSWNRCAKGLVDLLVAYALTLPESEKKQVISEAIRPLFEALLTLSEIPDEGLIALSLSACGYQEYLRRLWPPKDRPSEEARALRAPSAHTALKLEETHNVA
jgi:hypothetical protein